MRGVDESYGTRNLPHLAAFRTEVNQPVGGFDHVQIVFDDDHSVAVVGQPLQHGQQQFDVVEMQAGGRFVEDVERAAGVAFDSSSASFTAALRRRTRWWRLPQADVARPTSSRVFSLRATTGTGSKNSYACSTVISSTSVTFCPCTVTSSVSRL